MSLGILDHGAFQRAALLLLGLGGALGALGGLTGNVLPDSFLALMIGAAAVTSVVLDGPRGRPRGMRAVLGALLGVTLAFVTWQTLTAGRTWASWSLIENATAGALFGLVAGLGLLPAHLGRITRDRVAAALASARAGFGAERPTGEEWKLALRAAAAHARTRAGLAHDASTSAAELRDGAVALTLQVIDLAGRCRELRQELATVDPSEMEGQGEALTRAAASTEDRAAREDFARAARTTAELAERLGGLRAAHDRLRARLSLQVAILESTALALSTRQASSMAEEAASLGPLAERVREAGGNLEAEALALAETT